MLDYQVAPITEDHAEGFRAAVDSAASLKSNLKIYALISLRENTIDINGKSADFVLADKAYDSNKILLTSVIV